MNEMPTWEDTMVPVLRLMSDGRARRVREIREEVRNNLRLSDDLLALTTGSGDVVIDNRIGWAVSYLTRVDALTRQRRGVYCLGPLGATLLESHPDGLTEKILQQYAKPGDEWWKSSAKGATAHASEIATSGSVATALDPTEQIEAGISRIESAVASELLDRLRAEDPEFFESAVVKLLVAMGYGGVEGRAKVTPLSGDEGIDGIVDSDALGLNRVYVQAKRYAADRLIGRPALQGFVGALTGKGDAGVFITTSRFSREAIDYADRTPMRLILIDGARLASLMIRYEVGVQVTSTYRAVELDEDFFA